jgi:glycine cleavage system H protein
VEFPEDLRYTKEHEWARAEGGRVRVGITDFAQDSLGDVVYVDLPEVGTSVQADVSDIFSPVSGTVTGRKPLLEDQPELVNTEPYGGGWLVVIEPSDPAALDGLLDADAYRNFVQQD